MKPPFNQKEWELEWGRAVGLIFVIPCTYFWLRGYFSNGFKRRMLFAGSLIITQGIIGWWMVKSGLKQTAIVNDDSFVPRIGRPLVSRLHTLWRSSLEWSFLFTYSIRRALVAGLDAGLVYNSWPKYAGKWIPYELLAGNIIEIDEFFSNPVSVQFLHRNLLSNRAKVALHSLLAACFLQAAIGIGTLIYQVPISIASIHQNGALILYSIVIWLSNEIRRIPK
uniref:Cytochrome c oxidase assembly protein COX15-like protein n=1 Tax=Meloidogyne hapla TaxID=6305 RepID=A0A1I8BIB6_MELHA